MSRVSKYFKLSAYKLPRSKHRNNNLSNNFNNDFKDLLFLSVINKSNNHGSYIHDGSSVTMDELDLNFICPKMYKKHLCWTSIFNDAAGFRPVTFTKMHSNAVVLQ